MNFKEHSVSAIIVLVVILVVGIIAMISINHNLKIFGKKEILNLEAKLAKAKQKSSELNEHEILIETFNVSMNQRVFKIFEKIILLQKFIFEILNRN